MSVAPHLTVVPAPSLLEAFERMRGTPTSLGGRPLRWWHVIGQQFLHTPAMIGDASGHRRGSRGAGRGQARVRCAEIIDRPDQIHAVLHGQRAACERPTSARQRRPTLPEGGVQSVTVDRRITPPTAAPERSMRLSPHAAPQYPDAYHAHRAGNSPGAPAFSRGGSVHAALADW